MAKALDNLRPASDWSIKGEVITWLDKEQTEPTQAEIEAEVSRIEAEYDANQYQRDRQPNYPDLAEQFDLLWHAIDADTLDKTSDFYTTLKAVKDAHPKG
jgi:hypothetical protein